MAGPSTYPFAAIVGAEPMSLALILTAISPEIGGVLVRGEKGTAKSTMVRALAQVLPAQQVVAQCRFACDPDHPNPSCPDGAHGAEAASSRPAQLVELPVGATEDRVIGSLDLGKALGAGQAAFEPGLLARAHRGILYVDEVNLLHDHLVDLLLDAAAMGRNTVERDGVSVSHPAQIVLIGTMNPEEGELRPQLLDRFGLTVEVAASRNPDERAEVVRRRLAFDADPAGFAQGWQAEQEQLTERIAQTQERLAAVTLDEVALNTIARVCAGFDVDGMRADIVTARTARAHAAWEGRDHVTRADIRAAALLALPHRRRRNPFDAPGLDEERLDALLDEGPTPPDEPSDPTDPGGPEGPGQPEGGAPDAGEAEAEQGQGSQGAEPKGPGAAEDSLGEGAEASNHADNSAMDAQADSEGGEQEQPMPAPAPSGVAHAGPASYRARTFEVSGTGAGAAGRRSAAYTSTGHTVGVHPTGTKSSRLHLIATLSAAAARRAQEPASKPPPLTCEPGDLRHAITRGRESNLVLLAVDASGSMAARARMQEVKSAVLALLTDAYQRRDRVGLVTFRGQEATLTLPPTSSIEAAAARLAEMPHGGRTPVAEGLVETSRVLTRERTRDPKQRALVLLLTDGRATSGKDALSRAQAIASAWPQMHGRHAHVVVIDCEKGRFRMGLARDLAARMGADYLPLDEVAASAIVSVIDHSRAA